MVVLLFLSLTSLIVNHIISCSLNERIFGHKRSKVILDCFDFLLVGIGRRIVPVDIDFGVQLSVHSQKLFESRVSRIAVFAAPNEYYGSAQRNARQSSVEPRSDDQFRHRVVLDGLNSISEAHFRGLTVPTTERKKKESQMWLIFRTSDF
jgi:hypothetical protein